MLEITFKYKDRFTHGEWQEQSCRMPSVDDCIEWYGLGKDDCTEWEIISVKEINNDYSRR